ncbi:MAG TPA: hypothetical protein VFA02_02685 [Pseudacidobacterium sp.]|nr:hypothetical protein [Pseudacidobacterium sp.]
MQAAAEPGSPAAKTDGVAGKGGSPDLIAILTAMLSPQQGAVQSTGTGAATQGKAIDRQIAVIDIDDVVPAQEPLLTETVAQSASGTTTGKSLRSHAQAGKEKYALPVKKEGKEVSFSALAGDAGTNILVPVAVPVPAHELVVHSQAAKSVSQVEMAVSSKPASLSKPESQEKAPALPTMSGAEESGVDASTANPVLTAANSDKNAAMATLPESAVSTPGVVEKTAKPDGIPAQMKPQDAAAGQPVASSSVPVQAFPSTAERTMEEHGQMLKEKSTGKTEGVLSGSSSGKAVHSLQPEQAGVDATGVRMITTMNSIAAHNAPAKNSQDVPQINPFQRMDTGASQATLLRTAPHEIAVGVRDPSLGWIEIQTQAASGHVNASLATSSTEAHTVLTSEVPSLTQFMADRDVPVHSIHVAMQGGDAGSGQPGPGSENARQQAFTYHQSAPVFNTPEAGPSEEESFYQERSGNSSRISVRA